MYGDVPPAVVAVHVNGLPTVWPVPQLTVLVTGCAATTADAEPDAVLVLASRAVLLIEYVPLGEQVTEIVLVVEVPVHPVGSVHVKVYGPVPPDAVAVQVKGLPEVCPVPQLTEFASAWLSG